VKKKKGRTLGPLCSRTAHTRKVLGERAQGQAPWSSAHSKLKISLEKKEKITAGRLRGL
jgi:hypothetical protein